MRTLPANPNETLREVDRILLDDFANIRQCRLHLRSESPMAMMMGESSNVSDGFGCRERFLDFRGKISDDQIQLAFFFNVLHLLDDNWENSLKNL